MAIRNNRTSVDQEFEAFLQPLRLLRELRATLNQRQALVEALLGLRAGAEQQPLLAEPEPSAASPTTPERPRLKRYYNE